MRCIVLRGIFGLACWFAISSGFALDAGGSADTGSDVQTLVQWLLADERNLQGVSFAKVVEAASGHPTIPVDPEKDQKILQRISSVLDETLERCNKQGHAIQGAARINEASSHVEDEMIRLLNEVPGWVAEIPPTASGTLQRSGYPDIRLKVEDGRIFYLDPKLYAPGSRNSSFRTFYYEPKSATNKINDPAVHLLVGIRHNGQPGKNLQLEHWELVDLSGLKIQLKAEFQASNRDLYREEIVVLEKKSPAEDESYEE
jgi:hypothetical protein